MSQYAWSGPLLIESLLAGIAYLFDDQIFYSWVDFEIRVFEEFLTLDDVTYIFPFTIIKLVMLLVTAKNLNNFEKFNNFENFSCFSEVFILGLGWPSFNQEV